MRPGQPTKNEVLFDYGKVEYGDKLVRGITVRCGYCPDTMQSIPVNSFASAKTSSDDLEKSFICRKLEALGWLIGRNKNQHRCPECYKKIKFAAVRKSQDKIKMTTEAPKVISLTGNAPAPVMPTREMTRDDRRIIFEKLQEVYVNETVGYSPGWTDHKVATDLGVPRTWVSKIRDENFGEELTNEETRKVLQEAKLALQDARLAAIKVDEAMEAYKKASGVIERLSKSINEIEKSLGQK